MLKKRSLIILSIYLLSSFIMVTMPLTIASPQPLLEAKVSGNYLTAGDENEIKISITNVGNEAAYDVKASLTVPQTISGITVIEESYRTFDMIEEGETKRIYPLLYVARSSPLGAYSLTLTLGYHDDEKAYTDSVQIGVVVEAIKPTELALNVDVEDYRVTAGTENQIDIILTNMGDEAVYDVKATLTSTSPGISVLKEPSYLFDEVDVGNEVNFRPLLGISRNIALGAYPLTLTLDYEDPNGVIYRDSITVGIFVDSVEPTDRTTIVIQEFRVMPPDIRPGDRFTIEIELKNLGAEAYDVQVQLTTESQSPLASMDPTLVFVGYMGSNKTRKIVYDLQVSGDTKAQTYALQLTVSYYDAYGQPSGITEKISIDIRSIMNFHLLNVQPSTLTVETGGIVTVEAELLLIGTETAQFVQVEILENHPFIALSESYEYIGRVDPDSPVPFDMQFMVDSNATPGSYKLQMKVSYWDEYNQEREAIRELPVDILELVDGSEEEGLGLTFWDMIWSIMRILLGVKP